MRVLKQILCTVHPYLRHIVDRLQSRQFLHLSLECRPAHIDILGNIINLHVRIGEVIAQVLLHVLHEQLVGVDHLRLSQFRTPLLQLTEMLSPVIEHVLDLRSERVDVYTQSYQTAKDEEI